MSLKTIVFTLSILLWPISLYRANTLPNFISYIIPIFIVAISFYFYRQGKSFFLLPLLLLPLISPKLLPIPLIVSSTFYITDRKRKYFLYLLASLFLMTVFFKPFWGQTIFKPDYQARQKVIRNTYLYPNVFLARVFQNKLRIIIDKFDFNITALIDPSNYLFGFHPREIMVDNQNLDKFPFLSLPFFLLGIYFLRKTSYWHFTLILFISSIISLSFLNNFDRNDFILFTPLSIILFEGIYRFSEKFGTKARIFYWLYLFFAFYQL